MGHCRPKPVAPGEGRVLAGFAEILFTLITRIRVLVYAVRGGRTSLCSGGHSGSTVLKSGSAGMGVRTPDCISRCLLPLTMPCCVSIGMLPALLIPPGSK